MVAVAIAAVDVVVAEVAVVAVAIAAVAVDGFNTVAGDGSFMTAWRPARRPDLLAAVGWIGLLWLAVLVPGVRDSGVRTALALPAVLFWPGYVLVAAAFPGGASPDGLDPDAVERAALAVAASVAVAILVGSGLAASPVGLSTTTGLLAESAVVAGGAAVAWRRHAEEDRRTRDSIADAVEVLPAADSLRPFRSRDAVGAAVAAILVVGAAVGGGAVLALATVHDPPGYEAFAVRPASAPADGPANLTAADYRQAVRSGDGLRIRVENHRNAKVRYVVVASVQVATPTAEGVRVTERRRLAEFSATVPAGEAWSVVHAPGLSRQNRTNRLVYRLYRVDGNDRREVARTHVWLTGPDGGDTGTDGGDMGTDAASDMGTAVNAGGVGVSGGEPP